MKPIEGVPESLTLEQYVKMMTDIGLDPTCVMSLRFDVSGIFAEVISLSEAGKLVLDMNGNVSTHSIHIPVIR